MSLAASFRCFPSSCLSSMAVSSNTLTPLSSPSNVSCICDAYNAYNRIERHECITCHPHLCVPTGKSFQKCIPPHPYKSNISKYLESQRKRDTLPFLSLGGKFGQVTGLRNKVRVAITSSSNQMTEMLPSS